MTRKEERWSAVARIRCIVLIGVLSRGAVGIPDGDIVCEGSLVFTGNQFVCKMSPQAARARGCHGNLVCVSNDCHCKGGDTVQDGVPRHLQALKREEPEEVRQKRKEALEADAALTERRNRVRSTPISPHSEPKQIYARAVELVRLDQVPEVRAESHLPSPCHQPLPGTAPAESLAECDRRQARVEEVSESKQAPH